MFKVKKGARVPIFLYNSCVNKTRWDVYYTNLNKSCVKEKTKCTQRYKTFLASLFALEQTLFLFLSKSWNLVGTGGIDALLLTLLHSWGSLPLLSLMSLRPGCLLSSISQMSACFLSAALWRAVWPSESCLKGSAPPSECNEDKFVTHQCIKRTNLETITYIVFEEISSTEFNLRCVK